MEVLALLVLATFAMKALSLAKALTNRDWNSVVTLFSFAAIGVGTILLVSATSFDFTPPGFDVPLSQFSFADKIVVGILLLGPGGFLYDWRKSVDSSDSAKEPSLVPGSDEPFVAEP